MDVILIHVVAYQTVLVIPFAAVTRMYVVVNHTVTVKLTKFVPVIQSADVILMCVLV